MPNNNELAEVRKRRKRSKATRNDYRQPSAGANKMSFDNSTRIQKHSLVMLSKQKGRRVGKQLQMEKTTSLD